jgi:hypothetical protein
MLDRRRSPRKAQDENVHRAANGDACSISDLLAGAAPHHRPLPAIPAIDASSIVCDPGIVWTRPGDRPRTSQQVEAHNEIGKPFKWSKTADEILAKVQRFGQRTQQAHRP